MKKLILSFIAFFLTTFMAVSAPLTPEQALARLQKESNNIKARPGASPELKFTVATEKGENAIYLFSNAGNKGFLLLSADDQVTPLLGYSPEGVFDKENMSPAFKWWLDEYARQIDFLKNNSILSNPQRLSNADREPVAPFIKTRWGQDDPYNSYCPIVEGQRTATGCVATVMAQVMKYYEYPKRGTGSVTFESNPEVGELSMDFSQVEFDYGNMINDYLYNDYSEKQLDAVAKLMQACGYAAKMSYGVWSSGASTYNQCLGLVNNFGYDSSMQYIFRMNYSIDEWSEIIYNNVAKGYPVIYGGMGQITGGHSFICDGYDSDGYFHFNWGWNGSYDGYYLLDLLAPGPGGVSSSIKDFNYAQDAVINVFPSEGDNSKQYPAPLTQIGSLYGELDQLTLNLGIDVAGWFGRGWYNLGYNTYDYTVGLKIENTNGQEDPIYVNELGLVDVAFAPSRGILFDEDNPASFMNFNLKGVNLPLGLYKATMVCKAKQLPEIGWMDFKVDHGYPNYVYLIKDENGLSVRNVEIDDIILEDFEVLSPIYLNYPAKVKVKVTNPSPLQLTKSVGVYAINFDLENFRADNFESNSFLFTLNPEETKEFEWDMLLQPLQPVEVTEPVELDLFFFNYYNDYFYPNEPSHAPMYSEPELKVKASVTFDGSKEEGDILYVPYSTMIPANISLEVEEGILYDELIFALWKIIPQGDFVIVDSAYFSNYPVTYLGETLNTVYNMNVGESDTEAYYVLQISYFNSQFDIIELYNSQLFKLYKEDAGIKDLKDSNGIIISYDNVGGSVNVIAESGLTNVKASSLNGVSYSPEFERGMNSVSIPMSSLPEGIVIISATDAKGNTSTLKLMK